MLKIRLQRIGRRNQPYYRLVVTDSRFGPKSGRFIEVIGSYDPKAGNVDVKKDRATYWIEQGAQSSDTAFNFLVDNGVIKGTKRNALPKKTPLVKEVEETPEEAPAEPEAPAEATNEEESADEAPAEDASAEATESTEAIEEVSEEASADEEQAPQEEAPEEAPAESSDEEEKEASAE